MSLVCIQSAEKNIENEEFALNKLQMRRDKLLYKIQQQKMITQKYAKQIEELEANVTSTFILRNKAESFSQYINNEIAKYSGVEQPITEKNIDDFILENVQKIQREAAKLKAAIQGKYEILCKDEQRFYLQT